jgi:hypothetical protein
MLKFALVIFADFASKITKKYQKKRKQTDYKIDLRGI